MSALAVAACDGALTAMSLVESFDPTVMHVVKTILIIPFSNS